MELIKFFSTGCRSMIVTLVVSVVMQVPVPIEQAHAGQEGGTPAVRSGNGGGARGKGFRDPATGMEFVFVKGGCFRMGDLYADGSPDERPVHEVCVDDFYLGKYEVTQGEWHKLMGENPAHFARCGERCPVETVDLHDVDRFLQKLNKMTEKNYRLPTEAEWEYAARSGGKKEKWSGTGNEQALKDVAVYLGNSKGKTRPVGKKRPNSLGIYDMSGNVWEWVNDYYDGNYYARSPRRNPPGPVAGTSFIQRGGAWNSQPFDLRATRRIRGKDGNRSINTGFRVALPAQ
jgi:formylglycine-generating enzyme required for sulfatase activity